MARNYGNVRNLPLLNWSSRNLTKMDMWNGKCSDFSWLLAPNDICDAFNRIPKSGWVYNPSLTTWMWKCYIRRTALHFHFILFFSDFNKVDFLCDKDTNRIFLINNTVVLFKESKWAKYDQTYEWQFCIK